MSKKVLIGMSGGVDSSVAAYLLKKQGYDVTGVTLRMWDRDEYSEKNAKVPDASVADARSVAEKIGINHIVLDCSELFKKHVIEYFINEYTLGRTPNPCIECNKYIKFGYMLEYAEKNGYDFIATGHYAKIANDAEGIFIKKAEYDSKDQTYVLYGIKRDKLKKILMPLWNYSKEQIREIAEKEIGMFIANKPDSMDICFIPDGDYKKFIREHGNIVPDKGNFVDKCGNILGTHEGVINFTVGQRKGLGQSFGKPMFVTEIRPATNEVVLGEKGDEYCRGLIADNLNFFVDLSGTIKAKCKTRYSAAYADCTVTVKDIDTVSVDFETEQRAPTPGQSVVFYENDRILGGGIIKSTY